MDAPIKFTADCQIQAGSGGKTPRVEILAYSGGAMSVSGWGLIAVDLAGMELSQIPLLADHDNKLQAIAGSGMPEVRGGELHVVGSLAVGTAAGEQILALHRSGVKLQASIGAEPLATEEIKAGKSVTINGRTIVAPKGGLTITTKSKLREVSFVAAGADSQTTVSIAAAKRKKRMSDFQSWAAECGINTSLMTADQMAGLRANCHGRTEPNDSDFAATAPLILASSDPVQAEQHRLRQIEAATAGEWGEHAEHMNELKASALGGDLSVDELLSEIRGIRREQAMATIPMGHTVCGGTKHHQSQLIEASFALAGGLNNVEQHYSEQVLEAADKMRSSASLQQILLGDAIRHGYCARPGERITQGNLLAVLRAAFAPIHATGFSTIDVATITSNTANKFLMEGFQAVDQTALRLAKTKSADNFKEMTSAALTGGTSFEQVAADGELKHGTLGEETYTNRIDTYGEILAITRQDIINDDLGALTTVPRKIGRAAMLKLNDLFWTILLGAESSGFFAAGHNNLNTAAADVSLAGLNETFRKFLAQTDPDGKPLGILPKIMLVPPTQHGAALALMNSQLVVTGATTPIPSGNPWQARFTVETSPYMEIASYTGNSTSAWYLLADPNQLPTIEIASLNGRVEPTVETADADFAQLGIKMRGYSDVGVALVEYRAAVKADGGSS